MHLDAQAYAELRGLDIEAATLELEQMMKQLLPDTKVTICD